VYIPTPLIPACSSSVSCPHIPASAPREVASCNQRQNNDFCPESGHPLIIPILDCQALKPLTTPAITNVGDLLGTYILGPESSTSQHCWEARLVLALCPQPSWTFLGWQSATSTRRNIIPNFPSAILVSFLTPIFSNVSRIARRLFVY